MMYNKGNIRANRVLLAPLALALNRRASMSSIIPQEIPYGYCHCGCGQKTNLAKQTIKARGHIKGQPLKFIKNHVAKNTSADFWPKVNKDGSIPVHCPELGNCWEWTSATYKNDYGAFRFRNRQMMAHRASWIINCGEIEPNSLQVLHKCDNHKCVRPDHLFLGTQQENVDDMIAKGRQATGDKVASKGEVNPFHKLTEEQVKYIRERYSQGNTSYRLLSIEMGVEKSSIAGIVKRKSWKHI